MGRVQNGGEMPVFSRVVMMKDSEIQGWLGRVGESRADHLAMALLGADEAVKARVLGNLSARAAGALVEKMKKASEGKVPAQTIAMYAEALERLMGK
jgi:flagellar motor switch protein FliG